MSRDRCARCPELRHRHLHPGVLAKCRDPVGEKPGPPRTVVAPASSCLGGLRTHRQHFRDPSPRRVLPRLVYAGLSRVTQVWLAGEPRDAVGVRQTAAEPLRCQMRPVSWPHMATSTRFRAPSLRMRLARWALTVLGVM